MNVWQSQQPSLPLRGAEGDLLSVRITVEAYLLEELLETLAGSRFPINPEIHHHAEIHIADQSVPAVHVDFPAWRGWIDELRNLLQARLPEAEWRTGSMLEEIRAGAY